MGLLSLWWVWMVAALLFGIAEVLLPSFIFLGFALAGLAMSAVVALFPALGPASILAAFAVLSLIAWFALRFVFKKQSSGARIVTRDINDN
jgi:membrane protein implicated in regulation of membrane protease activity